MHALRRYLRDGLDARGWQMTELSRASGLTKQRVSQMLADDRDLLPSAPKRETVLGLARAFGVSESTVMAVVFEAMGYDLDAVRRESDLSTATTADIVRTLASRLGVGLDSPQESDGRGNAAPTSAPPLTVLNTDDPGLPEPGTAAAYETPAQPGYGSQDPDPEDYEGR